MSVSWFGTSKEFKNCWDNALKTEFCYLLSVLFNIADKSSTATPTPATLHCNPPQLQHCNPHNPTRENNFQIRTIEV